MLIVMLATAAPLLALMQGSTSQSASHRMAEVQQRLKHAKNNLFALAVTYADNYGPSGAGRGHFPCPNSNVPDEQRKNEGPTPPCGGKPFYTGRLPRLAGISSTGKVLNYQADHYDAENALWYVISGGFVNNPFSNGTRVNPGADGVLSLDGADELLALLIDAGSPLGNQFNQRPNADPAVYLESGFDNGHFSRSSDQKTNDVFLAIERDDVMPLVTARVLGSVRQWLLDYRDLRFGLAVTAPCFPEAAATQDGACQSGNTDGWLAVSAGDCAGNLFAGLQFEAVQRELHWFIKNQRWRCLRYKVAPECLTMFSLSCIVLPKSVEFEGVVYPAVEITPDPGQI